MTLSKLAASYFVPTFVFAALLCGAFFSEIGLLEKWVLGDNEIRQIVSSPPAHTRTHDGNHLKVDDETGLLSHNGFHAAHEDSLRTAHPMAKVCFNQTTLSSVQNNTKE